MNTLLPRISAIPSSPGASSSIIDACLRENLSKRETAMRSCLSRSVILSHRADSMSPFMPLSGATVPVSL